MIEIGNGTGRLGDHGGGDKEEVICPRSLAWLAAAHGQVHQQDGEHQRRSRGGGKIMSLFLTLKSFGDVCGIQMQSPGESEKTVWEPRFTCSSALNKTNKPLDDSTLITQSSPGSL